MNVLILDDSVVFRVAIKKSLEEIKSIKSIKTVNSGEEALLQLQKDHYHLFIVDYELPSMDGIEVIRNVREFDKNIKILIFSSYSTKGAQVTLGALAAGANDYLPKPEEEVITKDPFKAISDLLKSKIESVLKYPKVEISNKSTELNLKEIPLALRDTKIELVIMYFPKKYLQLLPIFLAKIEKDLSFPIIIMTPHQDKLSFGMEKELSKISSVSIIEVKGDTKLKEGNIYRASYDSYLVAQEEKYSIGVKNYIGGEDVDNEKNLFSSFTKGYDENLLIFNLNNGPQKKEIRNKKIDLKNSKLIYLTEELEGISWNKATGTFLCSAKILSELINNLSHREINLNKEKNNIPDIFEYITRRTGNTINDKMTNIIASIISRMENTGIESREEYIKFFLSNKEEEERLISSVTNHSTKWFRHERHFLFLKNHIERKYLKGKRSFSILCAGCSSGEEVYSCAITFEELKRNYPDLNYKITGIDVDMISIEKARKGNYEYQSYKDIPEIYKTHFDIDDLVYKVKEEIKKNCSFFCMNLLTDYKPINVYDLIFSRYILIYFNSKNVKIIVEHLRDSLPTDGFLFIGEKEMILDKQFKKIEVGIYEKSDLVIN